MRILTPFKMIGRYEDGEEIEVGGSDEFACMGNLIGHQYKHGKLVWYSGVCDEDYVDGHYVGRENFIYE